MDFQRKHHNLPRRNYSGQSSSRQVNSKQTPDILEVWEQQRRIREREAQLEREYEQTKRQLKEIQIKMKQNAGLLTDVSDLQTTIREDMSRGVKKIRLWLVKTVKKFNVKAEGFYIKTRFRLGLPVGNRSSFKREQAAMLAVIVGLVGAGYLVAGNGSSPANPTAVQGQTQIAGSPILLDQKPEFDILTPGGRGTEELGGLAKINPPDADPVYAYADSIGDVGIRVSQQQLPQNLKDNPAELEEMAKGFNASRTLSVDSRTIYIGRNASGPQSLLFIDSDLLVLVTSDAEISDQGWVEYLKNLKK